MRAKVALASNSSLELLSRRIDELERENARLHALSHQDELTGLSNRRGFELHLERTCELQARHGRGAVVLMLDVDGLKAVNDAFGHVAGDGMLRGIGAAIRRMIRGSDLAARFGGDEYAVILAETTLEDALQVAERIRAAIAAWTGSDGVRVTASIGAASLERASRTAVARADRALYRAKRQGGDQVCADLHLVAD